MSLDDVDVALLRALIDHPKAGVREYARSLNLARATVQARIDRLHSTGVISDWSPHLSAAAMGFPVMALVHVHLRQGTLDTVSRQLQAIPQVLEAYSTTGDADMFCRVAARDHQDLEAVIQGIIAIDGVVRTRSDIALSERISPRVLPLVKLLSTDAPESNRTGSRSSTPRAGKSAEV